MNANIGDRTVKDLVLEEGALAHLFEKYGIDYFCQGDELLVSACKRKGLMIESVLQEMEVAKSGRPYSFLHCNLWRTEFLIEYIIENHHRYCKETIPVLLTHLSTLVKEDPEKHSYLKPVMFLFHPCVRELEQHMRKEEMILFPYIKSLASAVEFGRRRPMAPFLTITEPVSKMQDEHLDIVQMLAKMRAILSDYRIPTDSSELYRSTILGLQAFAKDVHQHIHLENNILFPRAQSLEASFDARTGQPLELIRTSAAYRQYPS